MYQCLFSKMLQFPVFGMVVELKLPMPLGDYQMDQAMEESLYAENYLLGFVSYFF